MQPPRKHLGFQFLKAIGLSTRLARWTAAICFAACAGMAASAAEPVRVLTEEFPPYNYTENGRITGLSTLNRPGAIQYYLYALPGRNYRVDSLEAAKNYQIGTVNEDVGEQFLVTHGFVKGKNLYSSVKYEHNYEKLKAGRIDLWIMSELTASYLARQAGDDPRKTLSEVYRIPELSSEGYYMAFGAQTPDATVDSFRNALEAVRTNGTY